MARFRPSLKPFGPFLIAVGLWAVPPASSAAGPSETWLRNPHAEVLLTAEPALRVSTLSKPGQPSLLSRLEGDFSPNIRFVALELQDGEQVVHPFDEKATWLHQDAKSATMETVSGHGSSRLRLQVQFTLADDARLHARCTLFHEASTPRKLALWSIVSLVPKGWIITTFSRGFEDRRWIHGKLVSFWKTQLDEPCLKFEDGTLGIDLSRWSQQADLKYGTRSHAGWVAAADPTRQSLLIASAPYEIGKPYPDEDCNVTIWLGTASNNAKYAEMELLSPWTTVVKETPLAWEVSFESVPVGAIASPAPLRDVILDARRYGTEVHGDRWQLAASTPHLRDRFGKVTKWFSSTKHAATLATAPFWRNAPQWLPDGSLRWDQDTFIETTAASLPPWTGDRSWSVDFQAETESGRRVLLQDGDASTGVCLLTEGDRLSALIWHAIDGQIQHSRLCASLPVSGRHQARLSYRRGEQTWTLQVDDATPSTIQVPFSLTPASPNLVIGRSYALPEHPDFSLAQPFVGRFFQISVTP
jgi:hypothetical protein